MGLFSGNRENRTYDDDGRALSVAYNHARGLTASAARLNLGNKTEIEQFRSRKVSDSWQSEAWEYFDAIGEIGYAGTLMGNIISRIRLYPAYVVDADQAPSNLRDAEELKSTDIPEGLPDAADRVLRRLDTANGGQPGLMQRAGVNLWVAGECYLVQEPEKVGSGIAEQWDIKSVDEMVVGPNGQMALKKSRVGGAYGGAESLPSTAFAGRIWRSHPRYSQESNSSLRAVRELCDELLLINRTSRGGLRARANAGLLFLPDALALAAEADEDLIDDPMRGEVEDPEFDAFETELMEALITPVQEEDSASAVVPLLVRGPLEAGAAIRHITLDRPFDQQMVARGDRVLERIMQGLDMPKDVVAGLANVKYSNAIQINEQLYKAHVEPLVLLICDSLTVVYLRPALRAMGFDEATVKRSVIWYDPSEILTRPDRAESANNGYDRKALSAAAWRKAHGYSDIDAPTPDESLFREALNRGPFSPELAEALFKIMAPMLLGEVRDANLAASPSPFPEGVQNVLEGGTPTGTPSPPPDTSGAGPAGGNGPVDVAKSGTPSSNATPAPMPGTRPPSPPPPDAPTGVAP